MIDPRNLVGHADLFQLAFSQQNRIKRYTQDHFYDTRLTVRCEKAPWVTHSSFDTSKIIDMAFDSPNATPMHGSTSSSLTTASPTFSTEGLKHHDHAYNLNTMDVETLMYFRQDEETPEGSQEL